MQENNKNLNMFCRKYRQRSHQENQTSSSHSGDAYYPNQVDTVDNNRNSGLNVFQNDEQSTSSNQNNTHDKLWSTHSRSSMSDNSQFMPNCNIRPYPNRLNYKQTIEEQQKDHQDYKNKQLKVLKNPQFKKYQNHKSNWKDNVHSLKGNTSRAIPVGHFDNIAGITNEYESNSVNSLNNYDAAETAQSINYQSVAKDLIDTEKNMNIDYEPDPFENSDPFVNSGNLNKLDMMTAADFDLDRYARFGVHETEIKDYVPTITFKNCIEYCADKYIKDKVVLVIRCGIGLLPLLCIRYGHAKRVIALEQSACIEYARRIIKDNMYSHMITLIESNVHDLEKLPHGYDQVDVIVSDFLGHCVLSQGDQMEQVIEARDRFLKPDGIMIPKNVTLFGQLSEQRRLYRNQRICKKSKNKESKIPDQMFAEANDSDSSSDSTICSWWSDVYGFDMRSKVEFEVDHHSESKDCSSLDEKWCIMAEPTVAFFDPRGVVSNAVLLKEFDMHMCTISDIRHIQCNNLKLHCITPYSCANGGDYAHMLELFMVVDFPSGKKLHKTNEDVEIGFSTSSYSPHTRYRQTGLLLRDQLLVEQGDEFIINEFHMWRGPRENEECKLHDGTTISKSTSKKYGSEENLKFRLRYTFMNKKIKAINRRCAYTLIKRLF